MEPHNFLAVGLEYKPVEIRTLELERHMDLAHVPMEKVRRGLLPWQAPLGAAEKETSWFAGVWGLFSILPAAVDGHGIAVLPSLRPA